MSRLEAIRARRGELLRDVDVARSSARQAMGRARQWVAPMSLGLAAGQALAGRGWVRGAAIVAVVVVMVKRAWMRDSR